MYLNRRTRVICGATLSIASASLAAHAFTGAEPSFAALHETSSPSAKPLVDFARDIAPIFAAHCIECHGPTKQRSGYRLDLSSVALTGGEISAPNIRPNDAAASPLVRYIQGTDPDIEMPPKGAKLAASEIALVRQWIDEGAAWPASTSATSATAASAPAKRADPLDWWSLRPIARTPDLAALSDSQVVDHAIRTKLAQHNLTPAPRADDRTLIRRLYFDLIGLPPTPEDIDAFVQRDDPEKYTQLVDQLLASPRYGERWARHWLDAVHYADTHGYDKDKPRPHAWPYRDYIIRALNEDKPYARFVEEQIAGDALYPNTRDGIEALGFIAAGPWDLIGHEEVPEEKIDGMFARHFDRDDMVGNAVGTLASTTVQCAQCHDHKFDPITQEDYYSLQSVFAALDRADRAYDRDEGIAVRRAELEAQRVELTRINAATTEVDAALQSLPPQDRVYAGTVHHGSGAFRGTGADGGRPRKIFVLSRGQVTTPGAEVSPAAIAALSPMIPADLGVRSDEPEAMRRAALARWLIDSRNPLVWRSVVNRVWQHHFGRGIVETTHDFGRMGSLPTHPELLDELSARFRDGLGGSLKKLHRVIVLSETYQQRSDSLNEAASAVDSGNTLLWRMPRRKLDAEAVRDSVLATSGALDLSMGGPGYEDYVVERPEHSPTYRYDLADPRDTRTFRRAIYRNIVRSQMQPFMTSLDCADPSIRVDRRNETLSPSQALAYLNNGFMVVQAEVLASRVSREHPNNQSAQAARAFVLSTGRMPTEVEHAQLNTFINAHGLANACRVILNLNEFSFVD